MGPCLPRPLEEDGMWSGVTRAPSIPPTTQGGTTVISFRFLVLALVQSVRVRRSLEK